MLSSSRNDHTWRLQNCTFNWPEEFKDIKDPFTCIHLLGGRDPDLDPLVDHPDLYRRVDRHVDHRDGDCRGGGHLGVWMKELFQKGEPKFFKPYAFKHLYRGVGLIRTAFFYHTN